MILVNKELKQNIIITQLMFNNHLLNGTEATKKIFQDSFSYCRSKTANIQWSIIDFTCYKHILYLQKHCMKKNRTLEFQDNRRRRICASLEKTLYFIKYTRVGHKKYVFV